MRASPATATAARRGLFQGGKVLAETFCSRHFLSHLVGHSRSHAHPVPTAAKGNRIPVTGQDPSRAHLLDWPVAIKIRGLGCAGPSLVMLGGSCKCSPRGAGFTGTTSESPLRLPLWSLSGNPEYLVNETHIFILHWPLRIMSCPHTLLLLSSPPGPRNTRAASFFPRGRGCFPSSWLGPCLLREDPPTPHPPAHFPPPPVPAPETLQAHPAPSHQGPQSSDGAWDRASSQCTRAEPVSEGRKAAVSSRT